MVIARVVTLNGSAQNLATAMGYEPGNPVASYPVGWISIQADTANANAVFIGASDVSGTVYALRIEIPTSTIPDAPIIIEDAKGLGLLLNSLWVIGTNTQKIRVLALTA